MKNSQMLYLIVFIFTAPITEHPLVWAMLAFVGALIAEYKYND